MDLDLELAPMEITLGIITLINYYCRQQITKMSEPTGRLGSLTISYLSSSTDMITAIESLRADTCRKPHAEYEPQHLLT